MPSTSAPPGLNYSPHMPELIAFDPLPARITTETAECIEAKLDALLRKLVLIHQWESTATCRTADADFSNNASTPIQVSRDDISPTRPQHSPHLPFTSILEKSLLPRLLPNVFSGTHESDPIPFLRAVHDLIHTYSIPFDHLKLVIAGSVTGPAARWWRLFGQFLLSTDELMQALHHEFVPPQYTNSIELRIQSARQLPEESCEQYIDRLMQLYSKLPYDSPDSSVIKQIFFGVRRHYAIHLTARAFVSVNDIRHEAKRLDAFLYRPPPGHPPWITALNKYQPAARHLVPIYGNGFVHEGQYSCLFEKANGHN